MLPLKVLKGKHGLPFTSSLPRKGKAGCLRTVKLLSTETKMRQHRPRPADDRFLPLKWVSRFCSSSIGVFLLLLLSTWRHLIFHLSNQMVAVTVWLCWTCICMFSLPVVSNSLQPHGLYQAPLSMGFPRREYRSGVPFPPPGDLPDPGIKPVVPALADRFFTTVLPRKLRCVGQSLINLVVCYNQLGSLLEV